MREGSSRLGGVDKDKVRPATATCISKRIYWENVSYIKILREKLGILILTNPVLRLNLPPARQ
jgi:hypothetical protein